MSLVTRTARPWAPRLAALLAAGTLSLGLFAAAPAPTATAAGTCGSLVTRAGQAVRYCPVWKANVPVYASAKSSAVVGHLTQGGNANWFVYQIKGGTISGSGYSSQWWAYTLADNGRWGYVPGIYFDGTSSQWTGLRVVVDCRTTVPRCE